MGFVLRRLPGLIYNYRCASSTALFIVIFLLYLLFHWKFLCTNIEPRRHISRLCRQYSQNQVVGDLCAPLCAGNAIHSLTCQTFHAGKETVFSAIRTDNVKMVFKLARNEDTNWLDSTDFTSNPTETEFEVIIQKHVQARLNYSISREHVRRLSRLPNGEKATEGSEQRSEEIKQLWQLYQDNEFLLSTVFLEKEIFPKVLGFCGPYFAVEYLHNVISDTHVFSRYEGKQSWADRVHLAVLILDLLTEIENSMPGGFYLCDIKASHFGMSKRSGKLKFLDLDVTLPKVIADTIIANGMPCQVDSDCDLFDCKSLCNHTSGKCDKGPMNNNLQMVCEKIFLGWRIPKILITPGLLMSSHTPTQLASLLRQCAELNKEGSTSQHVQERLISVVSEIDRILSDPSYDY